MKILGYIFAFILNPFGMLFETDIKSTSVSKHKWLEILLLVIISIAAAASIVYVSHRFMERKPL